MEYKKVSVKRLILQEIILVLILFCLTLLLLLFSSYDSKVFWIGLSILSFLTLLIGAVYLPLLWKISGFKTESQNLVIRKGILLHRKSIVPTQQIINVVIVKNVFTPILKIASIRIFVAGSSVLIFGAEVKDLEVLARSLSKNYN